VRKPKLPATFTVQSTKELTRALQMTENEAIAAGAPAAVARDVTYPLSQELSKRIGPSEPVELYPVALYHLIVESAAKGETKDAISAKLRAAHLRGDLKAASR
jgi:hypothetical protein